MSDFFFGKTKIQLMSYVLLENFVFEPQWSDFGVDDFDDLVLILFRERQRLGFLHAYK
jgi:hypothetical protein